MRAAKLTDQLGRDSAAYSFTLASLLRSPPHSFFIFHLLSARVRKSPSQFENPARRLIASACQDLSASPDSRVSQGLPQSSRGAEAAASRKGIALGFPPPAAAPAASRHPPASGSRRLTPATPAAGAAPGRRYPAGTGGGAFSPAPHRSVTPGGGVQSGRAVRRFIAAVRCGAVAEPWRNLPWLHRVGEGSPGPPGWRG